MSGLPRLLWQRMMNRCPETQEAQASAPVLGNSMGATFQAGGVAQVKGG